MKQLLSFCICVAILASCCENEQPAIPKKVVLQVSGKAIEFTYNIGLTNDKDSLSVALFTHSPTGALRSGYYVGYLSAATGIQPIGPGGILTNYSSYMGDGDIVGNFYNLDNGDAIQDYINVIAFSAEDKSATIELQASYLVDSVFHYDPSSPDTLILGKSVFTLEFE